MVHCQEILFSTPFLSVKLFSPQAWVWGESVLTQEQHRWQREDGFASRPCLRAGNWEQSHGAWTLAEGSLHIPQVLKALSLVVLVSGLTGSLVFFTLRGGWILTFPGISTFVTNEVTVETDSFAIFPTLMLAIMSTRMFLSPSNHRRNCSR